MEGYLFSRALEAIIAGALGAVMGSFLYVVALNVSQLEKIVRRRSGCPHCGHPLRWYELIPLVSYLIQQGRCRACQGRLSPAYFWSEIGVAALFASLYWWAAPTAVISLLLLMLAVSAWFVLLVDDWRTLTIDVGLFFKLAWGLAIGSVLVQAALTDWQIVWSGVIGAIIGGVSLFLIRSIGTWIMKREAMGDGDPPVGALVGLVVGGFVGWPSVVFDLLASFMIGSLIGLLPMIWRRRFDSMKEVPYTPALFLAGWLALLWGPEIVNWYLWLL